MTRKLYISDLLPVRVKATTTGIRQLRSTLFWSLPEDRSTLLHAADLIDKVRELPIGEELFVYLTKGGHFHTGHTLEYIQMMCDHAEEKGNEPFLANWDYMYYFKRTPKLYIFRAIRYEIV